MLNGSDFHHSCGSRVFLAGIEFIVSDNKVVFLGDLFGLLRNFLLVTEKLIFILIIFLIFSNSLIRSSVEMNFQVLQILGGNVLQAILQRSKVITILNCFLVTLCHF